jgi:hypothetical protein
MPNGDYDFSFVEKMKDALVEAGFADVFLDKKDIQVLDNFETTAFDAIDGSDLFVALVGTGWLRLLEERIRNDQWDAVVREIKWALKLEKKILIVTVDGAEVPRYESLPLDIKDFHLQTGISVRSNASITAIADEINKPAKEIAQFRKIGTWWRTLYLVLAFLAYFFCAFYPNWVGYNEYGAEAWKGMAKAWGGFFIWPALFLPFILYALYRPLTTIVESVIQAIAQHKRPAVYLMPLLVTTAVAAVAWLVEVYDASQVPWTIFPPLPAPGCQAGPPPPPPRQVGAISRPESSDILESLSSYDESGTLRRQYQQYQSVPFWLRSGCWPNVFFYLTVPVYSGLADPAYVSERRGHQQSFVKMLDDKTRIGLGVPDSRTAYAYRISFAIIVWLGICGVVMAGFYFAVKIRDPRSQELRKRPSEEAFLCLTYSLAATMTWIPFRMNTEYFKYIYRCETLPCPPVGLTYYFPDMLLGSMLFCGFVFCTLGLIARYKRVVISLVGSLAIALSLLAAFAVYDYHDEIARMTEYWQFYAMLSVPLMVIFFVLWFVFDPGLVHTSDFRRDVDSR